MRAVDPAVAMASRRVVPREEAYEFLRKKKRRGETLSDVVLRLRAASKPLTSFAAAWKEMPNQDIAKIREAIRKGRELDHRRIERLLRRRED
jgi:predicted CopG family antitoxin